MRKKLKDLWNRRKYIIVLGGLVVLGAAWIVWLLHDFVYSSNHIELPLEQRIAFVSLWVAIVGFSLAVAGTVIAVLQFQVSQRKPDLYLWVNEVGRTTVAFPPDTVPIRLVVQNAGTRVARYVKCQVTFSMPVRPRASSGKVVWPQRVSKAPFHALYPHQHWELVGGVSTTAFFVGGDDYIIYDDKSGENLGLFMVNLEGLEKGRYKMDYELRCEGMERKSDTLWIEVSEEALET